MKKELKEKLIKTAQQKLPKNDPSHDFEHAIRVMRTAINIAKQEKADLEIIIASALFHDLINYPKHSPKANLSTDHSAIETEKILKKQQDFPQHKISAVSEAIKNCSFSKGIKHTILEQQILQDADGLEATGAISIMRTYASTGCMNRPFYNPQDPFCKKRQPDAKHYALDLFYERLLKVEKRMYTKTAKIIAKRRTEFLKKFLKEFELELEGK